jgi:hypothetical protein
LPKWKTSEDRFSWVEPLKQTIWYLFDNGSIRSAKPVRHSGRTCRSAMRANSRIVLLLQRAVFLEALYNVDDIHFIVSPFSCGLTYRLPRVRLLYRSRQNQKACQ